MPKWLTKYRLEARLMLRMSAAGLLAFALAQLLGLARDYWAVLTAVIVMQASVGGSLKAMVDRFLGTMGGAAWEPRSRPFFPTGLPPRPVLRWWSRWCRWPVY
jgi:hypothetical protein